jgi:hypothetical protein
MKRDQVKKSRFLSKEDIGEGVALTIKGAAKENVAIEGKAPDIKVCVHFTESSKPLVLNLINFDSIVEITKKDDTDNWAGSKVFVYFDPNVSFEAKKCGGIRIRAVKDGDKSYVAPKVDSSAPAWNK